MGGGTKGTINAIRSDLNILDDDKFNPYERVVSAWLIKNSWPDPKFCSRGDSGSFALNADTGNLVGLIFGADECEGWGYMTPIDLIINDIEKVTRGVVLKPIPVDDGQDPY